MSDNDQTSQGTGPGSTESATQDSEAPDATTDNQGGTEAPATSDTFSRTYVEALRTESAGHRVKASTAAARLVEAYAAATNRLVDATDLQASDALLGEDGLPDAGKVADAVAELVKAKPHLGKIRPMGNVGQGSRPDATSDGAGAFASLLRGVTL